MFLSKFDRVYIWQIMLSKQTLNGVKIYALN